MAASGRFAGSSSLLKKISSTVCKSCGTPFSTDSAPRWYSTGQSLKYSHKSVAFIAAGSASVALLGSWVWSSRRDIHFPKLSAAQPWVESHDATGKSTPRHKFNFIADVVEKAAPAVVHIEIQGKHPFSRQGMVMSNGSGFIVREDGLVLTNAHVVANKRQVSVKLHDGRTFEGMVQAVDPVSDLATIKISATDLPTIKLGRSSTLRPGEFVVAMGSPFQLDNTVTSGIVSSVQRGSRELGLHNKDMDYIQTDAVINFGNSGGPLVNLDGEAIGINTMKVTTGISFAIPSDYAQNFLDKAKNIETRGKSRGWFGSDSDVTRPKRRYMGITMLTLTPAIINELRTRYNQPFSDVTKGVLVHKIVVGSPAFDGGLRPGDVITQINGNEIASSSDIYRLVEEQSELKVTVKRGSDTVKLTVIAEEVN